MGEKQSGSKGIYKVKFKLGQTVEYNGFKCEVVGIKRTELGKGPVVYELVLPSKMWIYKRKMWELVVFKNYIGYVEDENLRNINVNEATDEDLQALAAAPLVGFVDVPQEDISLVA